jgi:DNA-binding NarL/FixJ family response regulator
MPSTLVEFSHELANTVEKAGRSVVSVLEGGRAGVSGTVWREGIGVTVEHTIQGPTPSEGAEQDFEYLNDPLTTRETEVLALLAGGAGNKEIAEQLRISEHTAKFHVSSILSKLGATTRTEAVSRGYRLGLILI